MGKWKKISGANVLNITWIIDTGSSLRDALIDVRPVYRGGSDYVVQAYRLNGRGSERELFENKKDAVRFARDWMRKHPSG